MSIPNMKGVRYESTIRNKRVDKKDRKTGEKTGEQNALLTITSPSIKPSGFASLSIPAGEVIAGMLQADPIACKSEFTRKFVETVEQNRRWRETFAPLRRAVADDSDDWLGDPEVKPRKR